MFRGQAAFYIYSRKEIEGLKEIFDRLCIVTNS